MRKSADRKAQISKVFVLLTGLNDLCFFNLHMFSAVVHVVLIPQATSGATSF